MFLIKKLDTNVASGFIKVNRVDDTMYPGSSWEKMNRLLHNYILHSALII